MATRRAWRRVPSVENAAGSKRSETRGLVRILGRADVKYQCQGETPQADEDPSTAL